MICTDSQSLCMAMKSLNPETDEIRESLQHHVGSIVMQWIPGHSDIPGNDLADDAAKRATDLLVNPRPVTFRSACMMIRKTFTDEITHQRTREVYSAYRKDREREVKSRQDQVHLAQLRSGKHLALRAYKNQLDNEIPALCPRCQEEDQTLEHWFLRCPGTLEARQQIFGGEEDFNLSLLTKCPRQSLALARRTLLGAGGRSSD